MIDAAWLQLLQRIPNEVHDTLALVTTSGAELVIQQVFKMERDFVIIRARTSGTGDLGRTLVVPYAQIDYIALNGKMTEVDVLKIFGEPMPEIELPQTIAYRPVTYALPGAQSSPVAQHPTPTASPPPAAVAPTAPPDLGATESAAPSKPGQISKTILLARLRERLAEKTR